MSNRVYVDISVSSQYNNDADPDGGKWSYQGSYSAWLEGVRVFLVRSGDARYTYAKTFEVPFEPVAGNAVFAVTVKYGTGGTFGHDERYEPVAVFNEPTKAFELVNLIRNDYKDNKSGFTHLGFEGFSIYTGEWKGYFEHLIDIEVHTVLLEA